MRKNIIFVIIVLALLTPMAMFAAGAKEEGASEHMDILFMAYTYDPAIVANNQLAVKEIEKRFNVTLSFSPCNYYNVPDDFKAIVASGDLPDCGWTSLTVKAPDLYNQGAIRSVPIAKANQFAPNYMKLMETRPLMKAWQQLNDKEFYAFYGVSSINMGGGFTTGLRLDWMETLGIKPKGNVTNLVPEGTVVTDYTTDTEKADKSADKRFFVTDTQYTYDEIVSLLKAFVNNDPDQNGKKDTYGLSTCILEFMDGYYSFHIFPVDGMNFRFVKEPDGSVAPQQYSKVYKKFLEMHKELDNQGLMIPEYWSAIYSDVWQYWTTGKAGAIGLCTGYTGPASIPPYSLLYENPNAKLLLIPPTQGRTSMSSSFMGGTDITEFYFNAKLSEAKFERCLQMFDWIYATDEGRTLCQYGVLGQNYVKDENGDPKFITDSDKNLPVEKRVTNGGIFAHHLITFTSKWNLKTRAGLMFSYENKNWPAFEGYYTFYGPGTQAAINATKFTAAENQNAKDEAYKTYVLDLLQGKTDPDTAYQKMMTVLNGLGYQEYLKVLNDNMYITTELLKGNFVHPSAVIKK